MSIQSMLHPSPGRRVMFLYWGKRGAMSRFALALAQTVKNMAELEVVFSLSDENELFDDFMRSGLKLHPVSMFASRIGPISRLYRIPALRKKLAQCLRARRIEAVVTLMPHVWSPLLTGVARRMAIPYIVIVHDVKGHIGDPTGLVNRWLLCDAYRADRIVTLSQSVTNELFRHSSIPRNRIVKLFLPNLCYDEHPKPRQRDRAAPLRLLFFGRMLPYKGLPIFVSAVEKIRSSGVPIEIGVFGEGHLGREGPRLEALGATIVNRWIAETEIDGIFAQYDALVLSHIEASQSGVASVALGSGLPIVTTPVGGLTEQVTHQVNGLVADSVTADALAAQISRLATEAGLYDRLSSMISQGSSQQSMRAFLKRLVDCFPPN
jgi:glycosyltransferase involved in cell wall biosynthesis